MCTGTRRWQSLRTCAPCAPRAGGTPRPANSASNTDVGNHKHQAPRTEGKHPKHASKPNSSYNVINHTARDPLDRRTCAHEYKDRAGTCTRPGTQHAHAPSVHGLPCLRLHPPQPLPPPGASLCVAAQRRSSLTRVESGSSALVPRKSPRVTSRTSMPACCLMRKYSLARDRAFALDLLDLPAAEMPPSWNCRPGCAMEACLRWPTAP